jgi:hypothetical protein
MYKLLCLALLIFSNPVFASVVIPITFYNYTSEAGAVFVGTSPEVTGPLIGLNGATVQWSPTINGIQLVGLQVGQSAPQPCFLTGGQLVLNEALYTGDTVSVVYGQSEFPSGISCGCLGSACSIA